MALIFDIETIGADFDDFDEATRKNLTRWIEREAGADDGKYNALSKDMKEGLGFSPLTGEIAAIGVFDTEKNSGVVYYRDPSPKTENLKEGNFIFKPMGEIEMLYNFWQGVKHYDEFVSFNGRAFDIPFLMIRSAIHRIKPTKNLISSRYLSSQQYNAKHIDILDQLSFYGAMRRRGNLHLYCRAFGIKSPKAEGITGDDIGRLYKEGRYGDIARYNSRDLTATHELYKIWRGYIKF